MHWRACICVDAAQFDERYRAPALDKGLDIMEILSAEPGGLSRAEIAHAMGRSLGEMYGHSPTSIRRCGD